MPANDAVLTWHTDPWTCGVAKFNTILAKKLGIPVVPWKDALSTRHPLVSMKPEEVDTFAWEGIAMPYDLFLHGVPRPADAIAVKHATRVFAANHEIYEAVAAVRPDVVSLFVPSLLEPASPSDPLTLFSFGMAHKFTRPYFEKVRDLLGDRNYVVELSVGVHEGQPWGEAIRASDALLRDIFGHRAHLLGSLTDRLLKRHLRMADWVVMFYPGGLRHNNTTFWAACDERALVITNLNKYSPALAGNTIFNIHELADWPGDYTTSALSWPKLLEAVA